MKHEPSQDSVVATVHLWAGLVAVVGAIVGAAASAAVEAAMLPLTELLNSLGPIVLDVAVAFGVLEG